MTQLDPRVAPLCQPLCANIASPGFNQKGISIVWPNAGDTDADHDVVSNIFPNGGTDPLAGATGIRQMAQKMMQY